MSSRCSFGYKASITIFFNLNYYAGLEDDADMGIRMITSFRIYDNIKKNICLATLYKQKDCFT